jgi:F1F0 ATPase subunit 2
MNEALTFIFCVVVGGILGAIFFGGLWLTIRKGISARSPAFLFLGSLLIRTAIVVTGFYYTSAGHWQRLLSGVFGFLVVRQIIKMRIHRESRHATHA